MKERERLVVTGLILLLLVVWLGFLFHRDPRFAGSPWGGVLAGSGSVLMLIPFIYLLIKRIPGLKRRVVARVPMRTLLAWHIYAGILGPILVILHTGHKFNSTLGITLTTATLIVVVSGFIGRYLMSQIAQEIHEKQDMLHKLQPLYASTMEELSRQPEQVAVLRPMTGFWSRVLAAFLVKSWKNEEGESTAPIRAIRLTESMADLEYAIKTHETFKWLFSRWLRWHIAISLVLYLLMVLHVWAGLHYGLRWFS